MPRWACTRCGAGEVLFASALNTPTYGSGMPLAPMARVDDGRLEVLRAAAMGRARVLALLPRLLRGTHLGYRRVALQGFERLGPNGRTSSDAGSTQADHRVRARLRQTPGRTVRAPGGSQPACGRPGKAPSAGSPSARKSGLRAVRCGS
jgi:YegS C-terminal NAD kinase beta sandwich-like domain